MEFVEEASGIARLWKAVGRMQSDGISDIFVNGNGNKNKNYLQNENEIETIINDAKTK